MNKIKYKIFSLWISFDLKLYLKELEKKIKNKNLIIANEFSIEEYEDFKKYYEFFIANTYSKSPTKSHANKTIVREAQDISELFIKAYLKGEANKNNKFLKEFFPKPKNVEKRKYLEEDKCNQVSTKNSFNKVVSNAFKFIDERNIDKNVFVSKKKLLGFIPMPTTMHYVFYHLQNCKVIMNDIKYFSKRYKVKYHNDGEIRCFYNALNISLHFFCMHGRSHLTKRERLLVFAMSALHPAQDDLIDDIGCSEDDAKVIEEVLRGKDIQDNFVSNPVKPIIALIDIIYKHFKPKKHPFLVEIFIELHKWQVISKKQKENSNLSIKELLEVSFMKGGFAFAFYGYVSQGSMTISQFRHFFSMGAIFQIMDDFHDIEDDIKSENLTIFTKYIKNNGNIDKAFYGFLSMQNFYEENIPESEDFKYPTLIRYIELFGARYDSFRFYCMQRNRFSNNFNESIEEQFPFDIEEIIYFFSNTKEYETFDNYMDTLNDIEKRYKEKFA